jgi:hypothetical protein
MVNTATIEQQNTEAKKNLVNRMCLKFISFCMVVWSRALFIRFYGIWGAKF